MVNKHDNNMSTLSSQEPTVMNLRKKNAQFMKTDENFKGAGIAQSERRRLSNTSMD